MLGLSLGSTSMFRLTWNKSGYFSWMSQASRSYLAGQADKKGRREAGGRKGSNVISSFVIERRLSEPGWTYLANLTVVAFLGTKPVWNWIWNIFMEAIWNTIKFTKR